MTTYNQIRTWPVIEHDQNRGLDRIIDVVTADHAQTLKVGGEVMVVCLDKATIPNGDSPPTRAVDEGYCFLATVTEISRIPDDRDVYLVRARAIERV